MGTRADYYIGRGASAEWIGSKAMDGYPNGDTLPVLCAETEEEFRAAVGVLTSGDDGTTPDMGWPWPWETSHTTDFAYAWDDGTVWVTHFACGWTAVRDFAPSSLTPSLVEKEFYAARERVHGTDEPRELPPDAFPNMKDRQNVTLGARSGVLVFGIR